MIGQEAISIIQLLKNIVTVATSLLLLGCVSSSDELHEARSYILFDARDSVGEKQPDWMALFSGRMSAHIKTGGVVEDLSPGVWRLAHFDYGLDHRTKSDALFLKSDVYLKLEAGTIYYLGLIDLHVGSDVSSSRTRNRKRSFIDTNDYSIIPDAALVEKACKDNPELFAEFPLVFPFAKSGAKQTYVDC